jgi:heme oxygenase
MQADAFRTDPRCAERDGWGLRKKLKQATAAAHSSLDARFSGFHLASLRGYRRFLEASAAALLPLEATLEDAGVETIFPDWPERSRSTAIKADLARLHGVVPPLRPAQPLNRNGALGVMYVLEGSRLGAKFLLQSVARHAWIEGATEYLAHGAGKALWQSFLLRLESEPVTPDGEMEILVGARDAFAMFASAAARA